MLRVRAVPEAQHEGAGLHQVKHLHPHATQMRVYDEQYFEVTSSLSGQIHGLAVLKFCAARWVQRGACLDRGALLKTGDRRDCWAARRIF